MDKNYEFKDLSLLSNEEKRNEIVNFFGNMNIPYQKLNVAEYLYNFCMENNCKTYYYISSIIINYFNDDDLTYNSIDMIRNIFKWCGKLFSADRNDGQLYFKVYEFCKKNGINDFIAIKDTLVGIKNLLEYCNADSGSRYISATDLDELLNRVTTDEECETLINNAKEFEHIQCIFRRQLKNDNTIGVPNIIFKCYKYVRQHGKLETEDFDDKNPLKPICKESINALYGLANLFETLLINVEDKEAIESGYGRFADKFVLGFAEIYSKHHKLKFETQLVNNFKGLLQFLKSNQLRDEEKFTEEQLKSFLMKNNRGVMGLDINFYDLCEKLQIVQNVLNYANSCGNENVSIMNLLDTINSSLIYMHTETVNEQMKLLMGESLGNAYGEDKDPLSENEYRYYLRALEIKELFSDVAIQGITPEGLNNLIRENPEACNCVRGTTIQMMLSKLIDYLFYVFDLDDGNVYYTNDKIKMLQNIGIDITTLITIDNLPYLCDFTTVYNMRKGDTSNIWYNLCENIKILKSHYMVDEIVDMIKYHPEVVFSDYNLLSNYLKENSIESLYKWGRINPEFGE